MVKRSREHLGRETVLIAADRLPVYLNTRVAIGGWRILTILFFFFWLGERGEMRHRHRVWDSSPVGQICRLTYQ